MRRRLAIAGIALGLVLAPLSAVFAVPGIASAEPADCNQTVVDQGNLFGSRIGDVQAAANKLSSAVGAEVRVRTYASIAPDTTLDTFEPKQVAACPSWQNGAGQRKGNLIELMVYFRTQNNPNNNRLGLYYGSDWQPALAKNSNASRIEANDIVPGFKSRNFAGGIINGMTETQSVITAYQHPAAQNQTGNRQAGPAKVDNRTFNFGPIAWVFGGIVLLGLLALGFFLWWRSRQEREKANQERLAARARAQKAQTAASTRINEFDPDRLTLLKSSVSTYGIAGDPDGDAVIAKYAEMQRAHEAAMSAWRDLRAETGDLDDDSVSGGTSDRTLTTEEYARLAESYETVLANANAAAQAAEELERLSQVMRGKLDSLPQDCDTEASAVQRTRDLVAQLRTDGFTGAVIDQIETILNEADGIMVAVPGLGASMQAVRQLAAATKARKLAETRATQLRKDYDDVAARAAELESLIGEATRTGAEAIESFGRIKQGSPTAAWATIKGNGTEADKRVRVANAALAEARTHGDMAHQEWDQARTLIEQARTLIQEAMLLLTAIIDLEVAINRAHYMAAEEIRLAEADLTKAQDYERENDDDVDDTHKAELREAERLLSQARREAAANQPNWIRVVELAQQANTMADGILAAAMNEVETVERARRLLATTLEQADAAIVRSDTYIENHDRDVKDRAREELTAAKQALSRAGRDRNPVTALELAQSALSSAKEALSKAKRNFSDAENRRDEEREEARRAAQRRSDDYSYGGYGGGNNSGNDLLTGVLIGEMASGWGNDGGSNVTINNNTYDGGGFIDSSPTPDFGGGSSDFGGGGSDMSFGGDSGGDGGSDMGGF